MGNQYTKTATYQHYYDSLKNNQEVDMQDINHYEVLGVSKNYTWEELVNAYRRMAKLVHPDKGGSQALFNTVTQSFKTLAHEFKRKEADKPHHVLKQNYTNYETINKPVQSVPSYAEDSNFQDKFNKLFDENKFDDEDNRGYGHMMAASDKNREDINIPQIMAKFSGKKFNEAFEKQAPLSKEVIVYKEPEALVLAKKLQFTELGGSTEDFSNDPSKKSNLQYTDYMKAYTTTRLVDPRAVKSRKEYKSVEDYESDRSQFTSRQLTPEELKHQKEIEEYKKAQEEERVRKMKEKDKKVEDHFNKVNNLFIGLR